MASVTLERTPQVLAAEINTIKRQTTRLVLVNFIKIGRRLAEAKSLLPYGEWGAWLKESVDFSQTRAERLMRFYDAYTQAGDQSPEQLPDLSYTQALILLGVPAEERMTLISELDIENITTRELQKAVDERRQAFEEKVQAEQENEKLRQTIAKQTDRVSQLTEEHTALQKSAQALQRSTQELTQTVQKSRQQNKALQENSIYKSYIKAKNDLNASHIKVATHKVAFRLEGLERDFNALVYELGLLAQMDREVYDYYKKKVNDFLFNTLQKRMDVR